MAAGGGGGGGLAQGRLELNENTRRGIRMIRIMPLHCPLPVEVAAAAAVNISFPHALCGSQPDASRKPRKWATKAFCHGLIILTLGPMSALLDQAKTVCLIQPRVFHGKRHTQGAVALQPAGFGRSIASEHGSSVMASVTDFC